MKLLLFPLIAFTLGISPINAREKITKIGTSTSELQSGKYPDWENITVFYKRKAYNLSIKPGSKVDIIRDYIGTLFHEDPDTLEITISVMDETGSATREHRVSKRTKVLTEDELDEAIESIEVSVFTVKKVEE